MKQKLVLIVSILVGLLAFWMTNRYLKAERDKLYAGAEKIEVIAAGRDLVPETVLTMEDLGTKTVYKSAVGGQAVMPEDLDAILNKKLRYEMRRGDPLLWSFVDVPLRGRGGLASMVKPGLRAISIAAGGVTAVSGLVQPNDRVDILGTFVMPSQTVPGEMENVTLTLLQDVTVLATGTQLAKGPMPGASSRSAGYSMVTFEVTPREAELLVFTETMKGQLTLSLRNPEDTGYERELPEVNFKHVEEHLEEYNLIRQRDIRHRREL